VTVTEQLLYNFVIFFIKDKSILSNVPDALNSWEHNFVVPSQFSERTMVSIGSGNLTSSARSEIVQMTVAKILNYCKYPTAIQYETVASKIVLNLLKVNGGTFGNGHVSILSCVSSMCICTLDLSVQYTVVECIGIDIYFYV